MAADAVLSRAAAFRETAFRGLDWACMPPRYTENPPLHAREATGTIRGLEGAGLREHLMRYGTTVHRPIADTD